MQNTVIKLEDLKKIYVTDILGRAKNDEVWSVNERKLAMLVFSKLAQHKIYGKDLPDIDSINHPDLLKILSQVDRRYKVTRDEFKLITGVSDKNLAREIKATSKQLVKRDCDLPNPFDVDNDRSFNLVQYFSGIRYNDSLGVIDVTVNEEALPYILYLNKYTILLFKSFYCIKNKYSLHIYMYCKIFQNKYTNTGTIESDLESFKKSLGVEKKYTNTTTFKTYVLEVVKNELNDKSDLIFNYELHKTGKRFTHITLKFSQKKDTRKQLEKSKPQVQEIEYQVPDDSLNLDINNQEMIISAQLFSYGIPRNKALEYIKVYGADNCKLGIEKLLGEIQKGRDIKNISGYLVSCIENASNNSTSQEIRSAMDAAEELIQSRQAKEMQRFSSFDAYVNNNEQQILVLLARNEAKEKLTDELEIDMLRCLKDIVTQYHDLESMSPHLLTLRFKGEVLRYSKIKSLVEELEIASKEERISSLKASLEAKKIELEESNDKSKKIVEKEITMLKVAIADLV